MPRWISILLAVAVAALVHPTRAAAVFTYGDTLTVIYKPLPNLPAIVRPGDAFTVWANAPSTATNFSVALQFMSTTIPLTQTGGGYQAGLSRWVLGYTVPAGTPEELYDLTLSCSECTPDVAKHAVKVVPAFKNDFYFAQISDTHLPAHNFSDEAGFNAADTSGMGDFQAVIADLNVLHPEFIIHTGDLVNEGELEEYLGMYEMGRALEMVNRLNDPIYIATGNHDIGGWANSPPPDGTARKNWWRYYGWPFLLNPPDAQHSQNYSFDYGLVHVIGLESYINESPYDAFRQDLWGPQSFTPEQMTWLANDVANVPAGHSKLAFYHYDFTGNQINPAAQGLDGAIWGHVHGVADVGRTARPFNLGLQAVIDGRRAFRIFRVSNGAISPGPLHKSGTSTDSLTAVFNGANNGTRSLLSATVTNRFGEAWDHAQLIFQMANHDSSFIATGGTIRRTNFQPGVARVYVDVILNPSSTTIVTVQASASLVGVEPPSTVSLRLDAPNPFVLSGRPLDIRFAIPTAGHVRLAVFDLRGRRIATLMDGEAAAGEHPVSWDGRMRDGAPIGTGMYFLRLTTPAGEQRRKITVMR